MLLHTESRLTPQTERLAIMLVIAAVLHTVLIFAVGFTAPEPREKKNTIMRVMLIQTSADEPVEDTQYLAQADHEGGGSLDEADRPSTPDAAVFPEPKANPVATPPPPQQAAKAQPAAIKELTTPRPAQQKVVARQDVTPPEKPAETGQAEREIVHETPQLPASTLVARAWADYASLQAEFDRKLNDRAKRQREKTIHARVKESKYAAYMDSWRRKIERIGNLNYPDEARRRELRGTLVMEVALLPNGTIKEVNILRPSGHQVLDEAALRIVHLAAPYAEFPDNIRREVDVLRIVRTWKFDRENISSYGY